jgi:hypothetical protein
MLDIVPPIDPAFLSVKNTSAMNRRRTVRPWR